MGWTNLHKLSLNFETFVRTCFTFFFYLHLPPFVYSLFEARTTVLEEIQFEFLFRLLHQLGKSRNDKFPYQIAAHIRVELPLVSVFSFLSFSPHLGDFGDQKRLARRLEVSGEFQR